MKPAITHRVASADSSFGLLNIAVYSLAFMLCIAFPTHTSAEGKVGNLRSAEAAFGPACEVLLLEELAKAQNEIKVAIYSFTRRSISRALADAVKRGVKVELKYDEKSSEWPGMQQAIGYMKKRGVTCRPIKVSGGYGKMHHKFAVIDGHRVLTGSFNYTTTASSVNYENLVALEGVDVAREFLKEYERIQSRGEKPEKEPRKEGEKKK